MAERNIDEKVDEKIDLKIEKAQLNSTDGSVPRLPPELQSMSVPPTTTSEEDLRTAGQRKVNMIWEYSQSVFAGLIVFTTCVAIFIGRVLEHNAETILPSEWWTILGLVIGFYFGRTNHARIGDQPRTAQITTNSLDDR